ncbi:TetR/AcrR family transcriptional regulator [Paenibacillus sp. F411]|uniref:TetR family regulatory protein n=1 Tax=Paenibacillus algicola TaxID=2565926 RepID=A0A4P8XPV7_9BACL|nr:MULTISPECIES: TetR/AcrR family transcriptional regulator [Paenibacillus]MBO2945590.1 TetR/AcrR family transcriptional regulator [Paenibacillus sp. F411]QCT04315.1 tetR family regulatory protein [Paenibacillus algicola]
MKEPGLDRRIVKTKKALRDALTSLMKEKTFDEITVLDLTTRADINRGTFYLHYRDKYDLLQQSEEEILNGVLKIRSEKKKRITKEELPNFDYMNKPLPLVEELFKYLQENGEFVALLLGPGGNPAFHVKLKEIMQRTMAQSVLSRLAEDREELIVPMEYLSAYAISAQLGVIQHWLHEGMKESPRQVSLILSRLIFSNPFTLYKDQAPEKRKKPGD